MELDIDKVCEDIIDGKTYRQIAEDYEVSISMLHRFLSKEEHSARATHALVISADTFAEKAEQVLIEANWDQKMGDFDLRKARELSQHYRWKAAKRNPRRYSEKVDVTTDGEKVNSMPVINWVHANKPQ